MLQHLKRMSNYLTLLSIFKDVFELCLLDWLNNAETTIERKMGLELVGSDNSCKNISLWPDN